MYARPNSEIALSSGNVARDLVHRTDFLRFAFLAAHIPLALLMQLSSRIGTLHALATLVVGTLWVLSDRKPERTAYLIAYIAGAEVLWRMTSASPVWEFGKYATMFIAVISMARWRRLGGPALPFLYFIFLIPSAFLTVLEVAPALARDRISFNLSGPLALFICAWCFSHLPLTRAQLHRLLFVMVGPVLGIATIAIRSTLAAGAIEFSDHSNFVTSGGFGPNQVSAMLGLGAMCCFWFFSHAPAAARLRFTLLGVLIVLVLQSALTFSRGGLYAAGGGIAAAMLIQLRDVRKGARGAPIVLLIAFAVYFLIVPRLDAFTGGALSERFADTRLTGRDQLLQTDLKIWYEHPLFGVGPGGADPIHTLILRGQPGLGEDDIATHTEFSRLLAEHGFCGLVALLLLILMAMHNVRRQPDLVTKAFVLSLLVWTFIFMSGSATRLAAPSVLYGLCFARLQVARPTWEQAEAAAEGFDDTNDLLLRSF